MVASGGEEVHAVRKPANYGVVRRSSNVAPALEVTAKLLPGAGTSGRADQVARRHDGVGRTVTLVPSFRGTTGASAVFTGAEPSYRASLAHGNKPDWSRPVALLALQSFTRSESKSFFGR
jgi:hypothetical protein